MKHKLKIILLDDDEDFIDHFKFYAKYSGWYLKHCSAPENLKQTLEENFNPDLILLDHIFKSEKQEINIFQDFFEVLESKELLTKTVLVTAEELEKINTSIHPNKIKRLLQKPIDLNQIRYLANSIKSDNSSVNTSPSQNKLDNNEIIDDKEKHLYKYFNSLSPRISIYGENSIKPIIENESARKHSTSFSETRSLLLMQDELNKSNDDYIRRDDWSTDKKQWLHSRLFKVDDGYWFTRQYYQESDIYDLKGKSLKLLMKKAADTFKQWGVTRVRLYSVDSLYDDSRKDKNNKSVRSYLLTPLFQSGDGFKNIKEQKNPINDWYNNSFTHDNNEGLIKTFSPKLQKYYFLEKSITNRKHADCPLIEWGDAGSRAEIPIFEDVNTKNPKNKRYWGLLSIDQRTDHLDKPIVPSNIAGKRKNRKATFVPPLTDDEMGLMQGFIVEKLKPRLVSYLSQERKKKISDWHEKISEVIDEQMKKEGSSPKTSFEQILTELKKSWSEFASMYSKTKQASHNLPNWYFLREEEGEQLHTLIGIGDIAKDRQQKIFFQKKPPFCNALEKKDVMIKPVYIIQDFQNWRKTDGKESVDLYANNENRKKQIEKIGSWFGYYFNLKGVNYLMVVHSTEKNYFTTFRSKLLESVCKSLIPVLLWYIAEESRIWFNRALTHELNTPLALAVNEYKKKGENKAKKLFDITQMMSSMVDNVRHITYLEREKQLNNTQETTTLKNILSKLRFLIDWGKEQGFSLTYQPTSEKQREKMLNQALQVSSKALTEILFNLIHNAFKYCQFNFNEIIIELSVLDTSRPKLQIDITNPAVTPLTKEQQERIFQPYYRIRNTGQESGAGLGLAVVKSLCDIYKLSCEALDTRQKNGVYYQTFRLIINHA